MRFGFLNLELSLKQAILAATARLAEVIGWKGEGGALRVPMDRPSGIEAKPTERRRMLHVAPLRLQHTRKRWECN